MKPKDMKWDIDINTIKDPMSSKWRQDYQTAEAQMRQRTAHHELYGLLAKNKSIHDRGKSGSSKYFSEGSTQYILRKSLANTIQRVPDGELLTQYDKGSVEHILTQYIFENKVMSSEIDGIDMLSNLTNTFKMGFIYGFAPVRTGFEKDLDGDPRISYNIENWADVFINADCKDIRRPQTVWHRSYMAKAEVEALLNENGSVRDSTYSEDTIKYILDHNMFTAKYWESEKLGDQLKGSTSLNSLMLWTRYDRGADEFITYAPAIDAVFRRVPNYDPRKGIPWNFFVLETDEDFPLGLSQVEFLLADQQFQDLFQTSAYKNLMLAMEPPIMVAGWETNPSSYVFEPRKIWNLGNNPNQASVTPVQIGSEVLTNFLSTRDGVAAGMLRQLNVMDGTVAKDSGVPGFSATPQGVDAQVAAKEISINQYQKRVEYFFAQWTNQALRMYINSMKGTHWLTVDETTRRKIFDIKMMELIDKDKIEIDFDALGTDLLSFNVRTGSLVEKKEDKEIAALQATIQPLAQNLQGWSDENKRVIENEVLLPAYKRLLELSDTDISQTIADSLGTLIAKQAIQQLEQQMQGQQAQLSQQGEQLNALQGALPPQVQEQLAQGAPASPMEQGTPDAAAPLPNPGDGGLTSPSLPPEPGPTGMPPEEVEGSKPASNASFRPEDLLDI